MAEQIYQLVVRKGPKPGQIFSLTTPTVIMGRDPLCDVTVNDAEVSRNHARLILTEAGYQVQDMGSTNGTFVDGKRLRGEPVLLTSGQTVIMGSNVMLVYEASRNTGDPLATVISASAPTFDLPRTAGLPQPESTVLADDVELEEPEIEIHSAYIPAPAPPFAAEPVPAPAPEPAPRQPHYQADPPAAPAPAVAQPPDRTRTYILAAVAAVLFLCLCCGSLVALVYYLDSMGWIQWT